MDAQLAEQLVLTTHKYIRILLASLRIKTHTSERSLLKNLGTWCGFELFGLCTVEFPESASETPLV